MNDERIKQRIGILLAVFQAGITIFIGVGVSLVTYWNDNRGFDVIHAVHVAFMVIPMSIGIPCLISADKQAGLL